MLKPISQNHAWPSGNYLEAALISVTPEHIEQALLCKLLRGVEPGLGDWLAVGVETASGAIVELIQYVEAPVKGAFNVRIDAGANPKEVMAEVLSGLQLTHSQVVWLSASVGG